MDHVGDRVELIGQIFDVSRNTDIKGGAYIFVNFGDWKGESVKISIWSSSLNAITNHPDQSWVGKWISVVGLMEPPYHSNRYGYTHLAISITQDDQIHIISEKEAKFRLAGKQVRPAEIEIKSTVGNKEILDEMMGIKPRQSPVQVSTGQAKPVVISYPTSAPAAFPPQRPASPPATQNQAVLQKMKSSQPATPVSQPRQQTRPQAQSSQPAPRRLAKIPTTKKTYWLMIGSILFILIFIGLVFDNPGREEPKIVLPNTKLAATNIPATAISSATTGQLAIAKATETGVSNPQISVGVVKMNPLNVRSGPGINQPVLGTLASGSEFFILGKVLSPAKQEWLVIPFSNTFGFILNDTSLVSETQKSVDATTYKKYQDSNLLAQSFLRPTPINTPVGKTFTNACKVGR